jgi:hypothetical protein
MKKVALLLCVLFGLSSKCLAHPPSDIILSYDEGSNILTVEIQHGVSNVKTHFISQVEVFVNDKKVIKQLISEQMRQDLQKVYYYLSDVGANDVIAVKAKCSRFGDLKKQLVLDWLDRKK